MGYLRASNYYSLERAYTECTERDFVPEMVFLLGRMGNNKQALMLIIERLGDVERVSRTACGREGSTDYGDRDRPSILLESKQMRICGRICCDIRKRNQVRVSIKVTRPITHDS
jgi:hypothetical protein